MRLHSWCLTLHLIDALAVLPDACDAALAELKRICMNGSRTEK